jgi:hypothetical protein
MVSETVAAAAIAALVQGIQAYIAMARLAGVSDEELDKILIDTRTKFNLKPASALPNAK